MKKKQRKERMREPMKEQAKQRDQVQAEEQTKEQTAVDCHIEMEEEMTIGNARQMKAYLIEHLEGCQNLEIDLAKVTEFDTAGVQLLILLKKEARASNKEVKIFNCSRAVKYVIELYRMTEFFGLG
ncbi:MAG: STAS domain-containing protein [Nitrospirae bacterium]|nr:STAS domain-containing protein [Nitrospirota bacterium]